MKTKLAVIALLCASVAPAQAINSHYRDQLIRSGCTEVSITQGCDLNKTKAQNQAFAKSQANTNGAAQRYTKESPNSSAVNDRLKAIKLQGRDGGFFNVSIGAGFTKAMIADEPAKIVRKNANWYEITDKKYVIGVYLSENGVSSASWNYHHGRTHGDLVLITE